ncbi:hypothetical protein L1987_06341 [Smallanthus sonchifolius]|uniref:Uncharacterized protein n=1 Tax=Smallanthus sonchifolius TaxID=185202 RepID=A0ACB9JY84_9ASTR|nr:hypothetical protein L1987_06341 [Smallanthus sonchifolius]
MIAYCYSDGTKEFTEDAIAKLEDDELLNEEDGTALMCHSLYMVDDVDMMDDVKQMAAALGNEIFVF